ncbi:MAG: hypothetical protein KJ587_08510 [Alphaproteobacteria bacterium]|nr:hypothetical protein [Alphaproteobacteria bacterium]
MATSDADTAQPIDDPGEKRASRGTGLLDHLAAMRLGSARRAGSAIAGVFALVRRNFFGSFIATIVLAITALGLNILALAGTIKVASLIIFDWTRALPIGKALGIPLDGATKTDIAWIGAAVILAIYFLAGVASFFSKRAQSALKGRTEYILYDRYLRHPSFDSLLGLDNFRPAAVRAIATYARSVLSLALIFGLSTLCAIIVLILVVMLPTLIAMVLIAILPVLLLYLLTGRRASAATKLIKSMEQNRNDLLRTLTSRRKTPDPGSHEAARADFLNVTKEAARQRMQLRGIQSLPEATLSLVAGAVLAAAIVVLAGMPANDERLIYLLIGFILIRFLFVYLRGTFANVQSIVQNLDDIRFVNNTILSDVVAADTIPLASGGDEESGELDELL